MTEVFADSFYWIALLNPSDMFHEEAIHMTVSGRIVTSLAVQLEVMDACATQLPLRPLAARFWQRTTRVPDIVVVPLDEPLLDQAVALFQARRDKTWSFTDCLSFEIMSQRGISLALTGDHHFRQAGYQTAFNTADR